MAHSLDVVDEHCQCEIAASGATTDKLVLFRDLKQRGSAGREREGRCMQEGASIFCLITALCSSSAYTDLYLRALTEESPGLASKIFLAGAFPHSQPLPKNPPP